MVCALSNVNNTANALAGAEQFEILKRPHLCFVTKACCQK